MIKQNVGQMVTFLYISWYVQYSLKSLLFGCVIWYQLHLTGRRFADRFGRKTSFYVAWVWLVIVSDTPGTVLMGRSMERLIGLGLCFSQYGQEPICMGKSKSFYVCCILLLLVLLLSALQALAKLCNGAGIGVLQ